MGLCEEGERLALCVLMDTGIESAYLPGDLVAGRYQIEAILGAGASGIVLRAIDRDLNDRVVAVKILHSHRIANERTRSRFVNEVLLTRTLLHENIVRVYESGITAQGELYLVGEYVAGSSLAELLKRERLPFSRILEVLTALGEALQYAHQCGILHRDLKPDNILISETGEVKLADFGIARRLDSEERLTRTGESLGTPYYMAPEMIAGRNVTAGCDLYAFGVLAYELSEGVRPFQGPTYFDLLRQHAVSAVPPFTEARPGWFRDLVLWCMEKDIARRPPSFAEVNDAIRRGLANELQSRSFVRSRFRRRLRRLARPTGVMLFVLIALIGGGIGMRKSQRFSAWASYPVLLLERESGLRLNLLRYATGWRDREISAEGLAQMIDLSQSHQLEVALRVWQGPLPKIPAGILVGSYYTQESDVPLTSVAAVANDERSLEIILAHGVDPNETSRGGVTPLHWASSFGTEGSVKELLRYGADPNLLDSAGAPALFVAVARDMRHTVTLLLEAGTNLNIIDRAGNTAISKAISTGRAELFLMLLDRGAKARPDRPEGEQAVIIVDQCIGALAWLIVRPDRTVSERHADIVVRYLYRLAHVG